MALLPFLFGKLLEKVMRANQSIQTPQSNAGTYDPDFQAWAPHAARTGAPTQYPASYSLQTSPPSYQQVFSQPQYNSATPNNRYQALGQASPSQIRTQDFWGKLITNQKTASPTLVAYIASLYNYLDKNIAPANQGGLSPEKIGLLGELQGYYGDAGLYGQMRTLASQSGQGATFIDAQFTIVYDSYSLSYNTILRPRAETPAAAFLGSFLVPQTSTMPLLTLNSLLAWMVLNILRQPDQEWACMQRVLASVRLRGPEGVLLPRTVLREAFPYSPDPEAVARNKLCENSMKRANGGDARSFAVAARTADTLSARMRDDAVWGVERNGHVTYWL